jgi:circadian clock protein KaiB
MKKPIPGKKIVQEKLTLQLYVSGMTSKSMDAIENIRRICDELPADAYDLEIIDIYKHPEAAAESHIVFSPSLIKRSPLPKKVLIGKLSDTEKVIRALGITPSK